jgi:general stress protein 26
MSDGKEGTREHFYKIVKDFDSGMLVTRAADGHLRSRPMSLAEVEDGGDLYFVTSIGSPKVHEVDGDQHVNIALQGKTRYASVSGRARVVRDRARIDRLWSEAWKVWFPEGKDDPSLCLLQVRPEEGEYWDNSGTKGLRYLFEAAKAYVEGTTPETHEDQNAHVRL